MLEACWQVLLALSPWLLLGMAVAGALHGLLPATFIHRQLSGRLGVLKAVALGVPLPLCSCGVIPAGLGLKRDGASDGASVGFLIATPQTGVDSVLVSASFLGWPFALFKVVAALVTGLVGGLVTDATGAGDGSQEFGAEAAGSEPGSRGARDMLSHSLQILRTIWLWVAVGVVVSAAIEVMLPDQALARLFPESHALAMLATLVIALPLYVCATASVPIAAALVASGMPGGAALVFLMAGPATNMATMGAIFRGFGGRTLAVYLLTIIIGSMGFGVAFDWLLTASALSSFHVHDHASWWTIAAATTVLALMAWFALEDIRRLFARQQPASSDAPALRLGVRGMT